VFAVGISLDAIEEAEHDRRRGRPGAFRTALQAVQVARDNGLYPYVVTVVTRDLLPRERFLPLLRFAGDAGALEVHVLEPSASGKLTGQTDVLLTAGERRQLLAYQEEVAHDDSLPILSSFSYLESPEAFGCGAGLTHIYIDGGGEVCPCNLVPLSFGNLTREPFGQILNRMGCHFCQPRTGCVGRQLARHFPEVGLPASPEKSQAICAQHLPREHAVPAFFRIRNEAQSAEVGAPELQDAYNRVHGDYDTFWLAEAARPVDDLIAQIPWTGRERVFEAGCGTGYATALLAERAAHVQAVDLSEGMIGEARERLGQPRHNHPCPAKRTAESSEKRLNPELETAAPVAVVHDRRNDFGGQVGNLACNGGHRPPLQIPNWAQRDPEGSGFLSLGNVDFLVGDALARLQTDGPFDGVFSSWVLGYIPLRPFLAAASGALTSGGRLGFIVHRENSPREPMEIFAELVAEDPTILLKRVAFDFPRDEAHVRSLVEAAGLEVENLRQDSILFTYNSAEQVLEHLLKSGAGTAFYDAIDPVRRPALTRRFLQKLAQRREPGATGFAVRHEYVACVARKP
jgi:SAM-dependent methyltransferase